MLEEVISNEVTVKSYNNVYRSPQRRISIKTRDNRILIIIQQREETLLNHGKIISLPYIYKLKVKLYGNEIGQGINIKYCLPKVIEKMVGHNKEVEDKLIRKICRSLGISCNTDLFSDNYFNLLLPYLNNRVKINEKYIWPILVKKFEFIKNRDDLIYSRFGLSLDNDEKRNILISKLEKDIRIYKEEYLTFYLKWGLYNYFNDTNDIDRKSYILEILECNLDEIYNEFNAKKNELIVNKNDNLIRRDLIRRKDKEITYSKIKPYLTETITNLETVNSIRDKLK